MYVHPAGGNILTDRHQLVGLCDTNLDGLQVRHDLGTGARRRRSRPMTADEFDRMIAECKPDCVIVTRRTGLTIYYILPAPMELVLCDVITRKAS